VKHLIIYSLKAALFGLKAKVKVAKKNSDE
jgi:hypothetical protein